MTDRPLVTFIVIAYNQERFIREAVESAFSQTYSPLEIILSDDCSTDRTFEIMKEMAEAYKGQRKLILNKTPRNFGLCRHLDRILELSSGEIIIAGAGDDISEPNRTTVSVEIIQSNKKICLVIVGSTQIDQQGNILPLSKYPDEVKKEKQYTLDDLLGGVYVPFGGAAAAWRKQLWMTYGPFCNSMPAEDVQLRFWAMLSGNIYSTLNRCVYHRLHGENLTAINHGRFIDISLLYEYFRDCASKAKQLSIINNETFCRLEKYIDLKLAKDTLLQKFKRNRWYSFRVLTSRLFSFRERLVFASQVSGLHRFRLLRRLFRRI